MRHTTSVDRKDIDITELFFCPEKALLDLLITKRRKFTF